jgi:hypothetical protein
MPGPLEWIRQPPSTPTIPALTRRHPLLAA